MAHHHHSSPFLRYLFDTLSLSLSLAQVSGCCCHFCQSCLHICTHSSVLVHTKFTCVACYAHAKIRFIHTLISAALVMVCVYHSDGEFIWLRVVSWRAWCFWWCCCSACVWIRSNQTKTSHCAHKQTLNSNLLFHSLVWLARELPFEHTIELVHTHTCTLSHTPCLHCVCGFSLAFLHLFRL